MLIYVGDSVSDLMVLLEADVGIIISTKRTAIHDAADAFGIKLRPLGSTKSDKNVLFTAKSWSEINSYILKDLLM